MEFNWNITKNKKILEDYNKFNIKKLPENILQKGVFKKCLFRTNGKAIYECRDKSGKFFYEVFINFVIPIPLKFWPISVYEYEEKYPDFDEFGYRAWVFYNKKEALQAYLRMI